MRLGVYTAMSQRVAFLSCFSVKLDYVDFAILCTIGYLQSCILSSDLKLDMVIMGTRRVY